VLTALSALFMTIISIGLAAYWFVAIVEVSRIPSWQFDAAGADKIAWVTVLLCLSVVGALLWRFTRRHDVLAVEDWYEDFDAEDPSPDWYVDEEAGALRWWDGREWTDRYKTWSGARPRRSSSPI
jgi:hypothetical protein